MWGTARELRRLFGHVHPGRWLLLGLLVLLTTVVEAAAASLVFVLADLLASGSTTVPLVGTLSVEGDSLTPLALAVAGLFIVRALLVLTQSQVLHRACYGAGADVEERLLRSYLSLSPRELHRRGKAELVRNVHDTVMLVVEGALIPVVMSVGLGLRVLSIGAVMVSVAPWPSVFAIALFAPGLWLLSRCLRSPDRRLGEEVEASLGESLKVATETLNLATELRMAGRVDDFSRRFGDVRRKLARAAATDEVLGGLPRIAAETLLVFFVVAYIAVSVARDQTDTALPTLGLFAYAALRLLPSVVGIVGLVQSVRHTGSALETLSAHLPLLAAGSAPGPGRTRQPAPATIELRDVTVRHEDALPPALDAVQLVLRRGDVVAVVGHNGSGKSTLIDVLSGQLLPQSGSVLVDGRAMDEAGDRWLQHVGLVAQHVQLLDADVLTNVTLALAASGDEQEQARRVLRLVGAGPLDTGAPLGEGPRLGEDGRLLSGGERQKISLARALYRNVHLLMIDEGTSALDPEARAAVLAAVAVGSKDRITVLVTHDPAVAGACTRVLRLTAGRLAEQSTVEAADGRPAACFGASPQR